MRRPTFAVLAVLATAIFAAGSADARVYSLRNSQDFYFPNPDGERPPPKVAIDGESAIAIMETMSGREALLFRRNSSTGLWALQRTLFSVPASSPARSELAMANNKAAIMLDPVLRIFERNSTTDEWTESATAGTPQPAGGVAISGAWILTGRSGGNCDVDVHEKSAGSGVWRITGRIQGAVAQCTGRIDFDIDRNLAMVRNPNSELRFYRNSGGTSGWPQVASFTPPAGVGLGTGPLSLWALTAIAQGGAVFHGDSSDSWSYVSTLRALNYANGPGATQVIWRDAVALTQSQLGHPREDAHVYVYAPTSPSFTAFDHSAVLYTPGYASSSDVSLRNVVAVSTDFDNNPIVSFFTLPSPLRAPPAYANDFTTHDPTDWQQTPGSQFARVASGANFVYRQSSLAGQSEAVYTGADWPVQQSIEADITPTAIDGADRWVGLAVRYVDTNNHYYVTLRSSNRIQLRRKIDGAFVTLADAALPFSLNTRRHVKLVVNDGNLRVDVDGVQRLGIVDRALTRGTVALLTYRARADFDNVYASPTVPFNLSYKDFTEVFDPGRPFTREGGTWDFSEDPGTFVVSWSQLSTAGDARAFIGTPTDDQSVEARVRLDTYGSSAQGAWFGLLARYVDANTHYYLTVRSTNRLEIRKKINGSNIVLASVPFTATPGQFYDLRLTVLRDELHAYVNGALLAQAHDSQIASGQYGIATYRAAASFRRFVVDQP
jgi:hypothetical protein